MQSFTSSRFSFTLSANMLYEFEFYCEEDVDKLSGPLRIGTGFINFPEVRALPPWM
jgi:hypothetical protein